MTEEEPIRSRKFQHLCPTDGWETCGIADSLVEEHLQDAQHGCSKDATRPIFIAQVREVPA